MKLKSAKRTGSLLLCGILFLTAAGCGGSKGTGQAGGESGTGSASGTGNPTGIFGEADAWRQDNTQDVYMFVERIALQVENEKRIDNAFVGGEALLEDGFGKLYRYQGEEGEADYQVLYLSDREGNASVYTISPADYGMVQKEFVSVGAAAGSEVYVLGAAEYSDSGWEIGVVLLDKEGKQTGQVVTAQDKKAFDGYISFSQFVADAEGNIHFTGVYQEEPERLGSAYLVMNQEGELLVERKGYSANLIPRLSTTPDGQRLDIMIHTAFLKLQAVPDGQVMAYAYGVNIEESYGRLFILDLETGEEKLLAKWSEAPENWDKIPVFITMLDAETMLYADGQKLYRASADGTSPEMLYEWKKHGISPNESENMAAFRDAEGIIRLYCFERIAGQEAAKAPLLLAFAPVTEKVEVQEISIAVTSWREQEYQLAAKEFNRLYPNCEVNLVSYPDGMRLRTELMAGDGPVLIDTSVISFAENKDLWECLDERLAQSTLDGVFLDNILSVGQIDGRQYGVAGNWQMLSFAGVMEGITDWNQQEFLDYLAAHPEISSIDREYDPTMFIVYFFFGESDKSIFIDSENKKAYLDSEQFKELLVLAAEFAKVPPDTGDLEGYEKIQDGNRLGVWIYLNRSAFVSYYDALVGENINYIGFPGVDGAQHYIMGAYPLTIRVSAEEWEKQAAMAFMEVLYSYTVQKKMTDSGNAYFAARKDIFERQLAEPDSEVYFFSKDGGDFAIPVDSDRVSEVILRLSEEAVPLPETTGGLYDILYEELPAYFNGEKSLDEVCSILQNRVQLYLNEK